MIKKIITIIILLLLSITNINAEEINGIGEVKTGLSALFSLDNDGDGTNDFNDLCKNTPWTMTYVDNNYDGCDDNLNHTYELIAKNNGVTLEQVQNDEVVPSEVDTDLDKVSDTIGQCKAMPTKSDIDQNGCGDSMMHAIYSGSNVYGSTINISGLAFIDNTEFSNLNNYTTSISFVNPVTQEVVYAKEATNYCDDTINENIQNDYDISCSAFSIEIPKDEINQLPKNQPYNVYVNLYSAGGKSYSAPLYSYSNFRGVTTEDVNIQSVNNNITITFK